jgi:hypothetical protein
MEGTTKGENVIKNVSNKKRRSFPEQEVLKIREESIVSLPIAKAKTMAFVAPPCSFCTELRNKNPETAGKNYSRVKSTQGKTRYCKCEFCGNTWKEIGE